MTHAVLNPQPFSLGNAGSRLVLTRRGRLTITLTVTALVLLLVSLWSPWSVAGDPSRNDVPARTIVVAPGDTMWGIASELAPPGEVSEWVKRIQEFNALPDAQLRPGQILEMPSY